MYNRKGMIWRFELRPYCFQVDLMTLEGAPFFFKSAKRTSASVAGFYFEKQLYAYVS